jgi:CHAD domain-containing protein
LLKDYRASLKKLELLEQEKYFSIVNKNSSINIKKKFDKIRPFLSDINKKGFNRYMKRMKSEIEKYFNQKHIKTQQLHELRKHLKIFNYNSKIIGDENKNKSFHQKDILPELIGKWNDCQITICNLKKAINSDEMNQSETRKIIKTRTIISSECKMFYNKIKSALNRDFNYN